MNRVEITVEGPVMDNLARITISDNYSSDIFHVDFADVAEMRNRNDDQGLLGLIVENCGGPGQDILDAAIINESPVYLDGSDLSLEDLAKSLGDPDPGVVAGKPA